MKLLEKLERRTEFWFLLAVSCVFFLLRIPSLFEPVWYGDEGIYQVIGIGLNQGRLLYRDIWDNKPPLLYILYAIFHADQPVIRFANLLAGLVSVFLFYFLTKNLFIKRRISYITTSIFAFLIAIPLLEGNIANAENFMMPLILGAALITVKQAKVKLTYKFSFEKFFTKHYLLTATIGFLLGVAFLIKIVSIFDLSAFCLFFIFAHIKAFTKKEIKAELFELLPLFKGFILPFLITVIYFALNSTLSEYIHSAFLSNVGYVNYGNAFIIPQGLLIFKLLLLSLFCVVMYIKREKMSFSTQFILLWLAFSIFNALFSQRPYTHYLLVLVSSFCLFIGILLQKTKSQILSIGIFFLMAMYFLTNFSLYNKSLSYYGNFLKFITDHEDVTTYRAFFDASTPRDYAIADFLQTKLTPSDNIFLWGNNVQLYALVNKLPPGRYSAAYWIGSSDQTIAETQQALNKTNPKFVIIMPNVGHIPFSLSQYSQRLNVDNVIIYERSF